MSGHLPPNFREWPRDQQVSHLCLNSRAGLIGLLLSEADVDLEDRAIDGDEKLSKEDLAAIYCRILEGNR